MKNNHNWKDKQEEDMLTAISCSGNSGASSHFLNFQREQVSAVRIQPLLERDGVFRRSTFNAVREHVAADITKQNFGKKVEAVRQK